MNRFAECSTEKIHQFITKSKNINTTKATSLWINVYNQWAEVRGKPKNIERLSSNVLDVILQQFYAEIKKKEWSRL